MSNYLFIYLFVYLFIYLCIYLFIYLFPLGYDDDGLPPLEFPTLFPDKCNESAFCTPDAFHSDKTVFERVCVCVCVRFCG